MARLRNVIPTGKNALLALLAAVLLILAFPDFEYWFLAWFALVPLMWAVERQSHCVSACFSLGWLFGTTFFFGTAWWLTYAPIHYAGMPWPIAYFLIFIVCLITGLFPAVFTTILSLLIRRLGSWAFLAAPFVWVFTEFLRYWLTGNNWNAVGYSQAPAWLLARLASIGGVLFLSFTCLVTNIGITLLPKRGRTALIGVACLILIPAIVGLRVISDLWPFSDSSSGGGAVAAKVIAIQPNVQADVSAQMRAELQEKQFDAGSLGVKKLREGEFDPPITVILPESPMNFAYHDDPNFQRYIADYARRNYTSVLFNSSEPDHTSTKYFNSAVMVGTDGRKVAEYDKIFLLPFGEAVPAPFEGIMPGFVGTFAYGSKYDLLPVGDAKAGVMICFESHFGELSRRYVQNGADVIIEMTNDGYLGPTPVLRQHLANAVFRAVETNRPVLRVTNVGITAYITETGQVVDPAPTYQEATRVWSVSKSDGSQTFYVKYGDWFAWLCTVGTIVLLAMTLRRKKDLRAVSA